MDFTPFLWDTSDQDAPQAANINNNNDDVIIIEPNDDVIIIEPDNDVIDTSPSNLGSTTYEYRNMMQTFHLVMGRQFVETTSDATIGAWYNALNEIQRSAWNEFHQATQRIAHVLNLLQHRRCISIQRAHIPCGVRSAPARSRVSSDH